MLEADIARQRAENRALTNSLLGTADFLRWSFRKRPSRSRCRA